MYLRHEDVQRLLHQLATISTGESRLAVDFYPPSAVGTSKDHRQLRLQRLARTGSSESFRLTVDRGQAVELVENSGWDVDVVLGMREAARTLVPRASRLPVDAVNEHKTLVAARMP
jgi:O-methyltransferase involved in polyketide biosynthesis